MAALQGVKSLYISLTKEWNRQPRTPESLKKCKDLLEKLKIELTKLQFLPTDKTNVTQQELILSRDVLEIGVQWSIECKDIPSFERYMAQLKSYYFDYNTKDELPESAFKYQLLGLNLLFLLSQNRVAEFHTELELLPPDQIQNNVYIGHPLSIEQCLMEGRYNKIFLARDNVPAASYCFFIEILLCTVRDEIAACMEKAYERISLTEATKLLYLPSIDAVKTFAAKRGWQLGRDNFYYFSMEEKKSDDKVPSLELAEQFIEYARELEMIV